MCHHIEGSVHAGTLLYKYIKQGTLWPVTESMEHVWKVGMGFFLKKIHIREWQAGSVAVMLTKTQVAWGTRAALPSQTYHLAKHDNFRTLRLEVDVGPNLGQAEAPQRRWREGRGWKGQDAYSGWETSWPQPCFTLQKLWAQKQEHS